MTLKIAGMIPMVALAPLEEPRTAEESKTLVDKLNRDNRERQARVRAEHQRRMSELAQMTHDIEAEGERFRAVRNRPVGRSTSLSPRQVRAALSPDERAELEAARDRIDRVLRGGEEAPKETAPATPAAGGRLTTAEFYARRDEARRASLAR